MTVEQAIESIERYVKQGVPTGGFLRAVLANDLMEAMGRADHESRQNLFKICQYIYNDIPHNCHGGTK